ncbi:DUF6265 family protein [Empedobacter tilapiae]|uniref:DUF6265 family protein n=1 Tax=Empedobacter tilapiae TaxID=2491114 RepID=UPI0028D42E36|nr:DUF6265 family protein [Empedobacter tilapiae]
MKLFTFLLLFSFSLNSCQTNKTSPNKTSFDFLVGEWIRTNEKSDRKTYENWKKVDKNTFLGCGFTIKNNDTISQEHLTISKIDDKWILKVNLDKTKNETTDFKLINSDKNSFILENQENDFPKIIKYWKVGNQLKAEISNDESSKIDFVFEKIKK